MERKLVFAPLARDGHTAIRIAGIADLESNNTTMDARRVDILRRASAELLGIDAAGDVEPWCGLRPMTPDSRPIIGWSPLDGLFINSGHGMLGWTLACGSARLAADMIDRKPEAKRGERVCTAARGINSVSREAAADQLSHVAFPANCGRPR